MEKAKIRFEKKIIVTNDCWFWAASKTKQGYGMFSYDGKSIPAHRFAYIAYKGPIEQDKIVHQSCNNTYCVNPEHLYLTTKSETRNRFYELRINPEMIFNESVRYLEKLKKLRPDLKYDIEELVNQIEDPKNIYRINVDNQ
jgi:hypothetical protein|tara:strand:- start:154 stop:576 length:423 start_codon:yes stop_codon:yes gene_type:complete